MGMKKGFTFIEMVVVIATLLLALPTLFAIIFTVINQQTKIIRLTEVKRQGDYALAMMKNTIRNYATEIYSDQGLTAANIKCSTAGSTWDNISPNELYFKSSDGKWLRYYINMVSGINHIASASAVFTATNLTSDKVTINNFSIVCNRNILYSPPILNISFQVQYKTASTRPEDTASLNYQTAIKLRSY